MHGQVSDFLVAIFSWKMTLIGREPQANQRWPLPTIKSQDNADRISCEMSYTADEPHIQLMYKQLRLIPPHFRKGLLGWNEQIEG